MQMVEFISRCNDWAGSRIPFIFLIDYECRKPMIVKLDEAASEGIFFSVNGNVNNNLGSTTSTKEIVFNVQPVKEGVYDRAFQDVKRNILHGNSYLLNLTFPSELETNLELEEIFLRSKAKYKILKKDDFVVFSPESFIKIKEDMIHSYPMKGTIDAGLPDAERKILESEKELWEHNTIVDLIRNDLSMVSRDVEVRRYRYVDRIETHKGELLQVSSEIRGRLQHDWRSNLGDMLLRLLPAGSICGAPKKKTLEIIRSAEQQDRGYFTGIFGIFDGRDLDSGVMIRYIEKYGDAMRFRSGGGITGHSEMQKEYKELIDKVYVPIT